jgi:hypothetical protein
MTAERSREVEIAAVGYTVHYGRKIDRLPVTWPFNVSVLIALHNANLDASLTRRPMTKHCDFVTENLLRNEIDSLKV